MTTFHNRPCAAPGLTSYRYRGEYGMVMIGAKDHNDAKNQAARSMVGSLDWSRLEIWSPETACYIAVYPANH